MKKLIKLLTATMLSFTLFACSSDGSLQAGADGTLTGASLGKSTGVATVEKVDNKKFNVSFENSDLGIVIGVLDIAEDEHLKVEYNVSGGHFNFAPGTTYRNDKRTLETFKKLRDSFKPSGITGEGSKDMDVADNLWTIAIFTNSGVSGTATFSAVKDEKPEPVITPAQEGEEGADNSATEASPSETEVAPEQNQAGQETSPEQPSQENVG